MVAPVGVITALYLREYAKQGRLVSIVRISVNNLAGVPSIVYGVFGLGFFAYGLGSRIDELFFLERLPNPTFGTGGLLWAALTLALLTVPVVIVATEEALAAVPRSMREGSLACGASKWQTIKNIVLPRAMPGIMTGIILAMARGAGEVAPLMLVGVVKLAPTLPIDGYFPYVHLERSFMHLGFHIYDVGFQSRNSEAGKPMVFVTTCPLNRNDHPSQSCRDHHPVAAQAPICREPVLRWTVRSTDEPTPVIPSGADLRPTPRSIQNAEWTGEMIRIRNFNLWYGRFASALRYQFHH